MRARAAELAGDEAEAGRRFAAALTGTQSDALVAQQAFRHGLYAADWPLALTAARALERQEALRTDGRLLLVADGVVRRDWRGAESHLGRIAADDPLRVLAPIIRAWIAAESRRGDPLALLPAETEGLGGVYAAEHRPLLMAYLGREGAAEALMAGIGRAGPRGLRLRIAAGMQLAARGQAAQADALLQGSEQALVDARRALAERRPIPGALDSAGAGISVLFLRLALDLDGQEARQPAIGFTQMAVLLDPENSAARLIAAEFLSDEGRPALAIASLRGVAAGDPFAGNATDVRLRLTAEHGDPAAALADAEALARRSNAAADWARVGELKAGRDDFTGAAQDFARAIAAHREGEGLQLWALHMLHGSALDQAGDWPGARAALQRSHALAPTEPLILNYLGYAQLARRENMDAAEAMVRDAHARAPDNAAITDSLGWALFLRGRVAEAIPLLEQAAVGEPGDPEINEHLGDAYYTAGRRSDARFAWRAALVGAEESDAVRLRAKIDTGLTRELAAR